MDFFQNLVRKKISELGELQAAEFFGVGLPLIRQWVLGSKRVSLAAVEKVFDPEAKEESGVFETVTWEGKQIAILLPFYKTTNPLTMQSICSMLEREKMRLMFRYGDAFVAHSRNKLGHAFVKSGIPWSFWCDDDMVLQPGNASWFNKVTGLNLPEKFAGHHTLTRLLSHEQSFVGSLYFGRQSADANAMFHGGVVSPALSRELRMSPRDELMATEWVGTGAPLIHRDVFLDIEKKFPELAPQHQDEGFQYFSRSDTELSKATAEALKILNDDSATEASRIAEVRSLLVIARADAKQNNQLRIGEDVVFCKRAAAAGHQPFVDLGLRQGHIGSFVY